MKTFTNFTELFEAVEKANGQMNLEILLKNKNYEKITIYFIWN